ncbi:MAG: hypothetical protein R3F14_27315 [Polyangiaceae bacterium]
MRRRQRPRKSSLSLLSGAARALALLGVASGLSSCGGEGAEPDAFWPPFTGCAALRADLVCELFPARREVRVALETVPDAIVARYSGAPIEVVREPVKGGLRVTLALPDSAALPGAKGTLTLDLTAPASRLRLTLRTEGAVVDERLSRAGALASEGNTAAAAPRSGILPCSSLRCEGGRAAGSRGSTWPRDTRTRRSPGSVKPWTRTRRAAGCRRRRLTRWRSRTPCCRTDTRSRR